jgi:hypothetical protein
VNSSAGRSHKKQWVKTSIRGRLARTTDSAVPPALSGLLQGFPGLKSWARFAASLRDEGRAGFAASLRDEGWVPVSQGLSMTWDGWTPRSSWMSDRALTLLTIRA